MDWKKHLKTEEDLDSGEYAYRLVEVIMHMKDKDLWIPIRVLADYVGSSFKEIELDLELRKKMGWFENPKWDDQIFPLQCETRTDHEGVEYVSFREGTILLIPDEDVVTDRDGREVTWPCFRMVYRKDLEDDSSLADVDEDEGND